MCTADLGRMSQGTGHRCTCSQRKVSQTSETDATVHNLSLSENETWVVTKKFMNICTACVCVPSYIAFLILFSFSTDSLSSKQSSSPHAAPCWLPKCISSDLSRYTGENMCSRTGARRDRRSAMMFHYIDYAETAVRMRNRQRARKQTITDRKGGRRRICTQKSVSMRGRTCETKRGE